ncbi:MAG: iron-sulfur cluster assembly protein [Ilumatobacteraceae bacterium]|nr:MAG: DUF59 domain-containing protein [Actinomycetota bacterium]
MSTAAKDENGIVADALRTVWDPELGIDVVSLGLVYDIRCTGDVVEVDMTLTTPGCPVSEQLPAEATHAIAAVLPDRHVVVNTVWDPPWSPARLSDEAKAQLGFSR